MRLILALFAFLLAPTLAAATIYSIDHADALRGVIKGSDPQGRLNFTPTGKETEIGVRMDGIREVDFERATKLPSKDDARFRFVFYDGSVLFGEIAAQNEEDTLDWLKIETLTQGTLKLRYDGLQRVERREDAKPDVDRFFTEEELKDVKSGMDWRAIKTSASSVFACTEIALYPNKVEYLIGLDVDALSTIWKDMRALVRVPKNEEPFDDLHGVFTTTKGERIVGRVDSWKEEEVTLVTRYFNKITLKVSNLSTVTFRNGRFTYLSDAKLEKADEYPFLRATNFDPKDHLFPYRLDRAQGGGAINLRGKTYAKGVGVHAISKLTFTLNKRYERFIATIGVDDSAGAQASVIFRVLVDGKEAKLKLTPTDTSDDSKPETKEAESSGVMRKGTIPLNIEVDVKRAMNITIIVEAADNGDVHDRANWANAMLVR
ncbi:MAG: NPCBM/NEW2 domain-containing protein [Planctomycetes bacterium]|nr:NPCBM/NEW2 domain-containing protein [Planctomycetota bacterium]